MHAARALTRRLPSHAFQVVQLLRLSQQHAVPVTFRAAGTSLSGQAITDSILIKVSYTGLHWRGCSIKVRAGMLCVSACATAAAECNRRASGCPVLLQRQHKLHSPVAFAARRQPGDR